MPASAEEEEKASYMALKLSYRVGIEDSFKSELLLFKPKFAMELLEQFCQDWRQHLKKVSKLS